MPKIKITTEIDYNKGDIYNMTEEQQKAMVIAYCTPLNFKKAKEQLFGWDYLLERADKAACFTIDDL